MRPAHYDQAPLRPRHHPRTMLAAGLLATTAVTGGTGAAAAAGPAPHAMTGTAPMPTATVAAVLRAFNTANCAHIYALTAPWTRPQPQDAGITACQQGFADGVQHGVTLLRLSVGGPGRYLGPDRRAYRQPLLLRRVLDGQTALAHETLQLVPWRGRWYVLALW